MFCPKCSNPAESADLKFCSRCGLWLAGVREAMHREADAQTQADGAGHTDFRKGLRRGAKCLLWGVAIGAVGYALATAIIFLSELTRAGDPKLELLVPLRYAFLTSYFLCPALSLFGVARMIYALTFERRNSRVASEETKEPVFLAESRGAGASLPPQRQPAWTPAHFRREGSSTAELQPASVTEHTTGLL